MFKRRQFHNNRTTASRWRLLLVLSWSLTIMAPSLAQNIPATTQLPIFFKLLTYDRTLWEDLEPPLRIGLLHEVGNGASRQNLVAMTAALEASADKTVNGVPFEFTTISWTGPDDLRHQLRRASVQVLYVTSGQADVLGPAAEIASERGILSLAAEASYLGHGPAVGLDLEDGRPRLLVDLTALEAGGHQLDARVLRLCRVVKR